MATETAFPTNPFDNNDTTTRRNGSGAGKRKRDSLDAVAQPDRLAPNTRRASAAQSQVEANLATASIVDMGGDAFTATGNTAENDAGAHQFDFDLQQPNARGLPTDTTQQESGTGTNDDTAAAALTNYGLPVTRNGDETFADQSANDADDSEFNMDNDNPYPSGTAPLLDPTGAMGGLGRAKPQVGSEDWHKLRKDNHKEVERRRRETINEGINEIAKIVPGCEKNKGSILQRAVQYIAKLQDEASQNIDKWTFEKLVTDQAITDLSNKLSKAWSEKEAWKKLARDAGVDVDNVDLGIAAPAAGSDASDSKPQAGGEAAPATTATMQSAAATGPNPGTQGDSK